MQYGPGTENSFAGVATAFSDSVPILLLPLGHPVDRQGVSPLFRSEISYAAITKRVEVVTSTERVHGVMRRSLAALRQGRPGPVMVEIPADVAMQDVSDFNGDTSHVKPVKSQGDPRDIEAAAKALCSAQRPVILAGQGVLYAEATEELRELSEFLACAGADNVDGKKCFSRIPSARTGVWNGFNAQSAPSFLARSRSDMWNRLQLYRSRHGDAAAGRQDNNPRYQ